MTRFPTLLFAVFVSFCSLLPAADSKKPNILFIVGDDMGYADEGFHGCQDIPTPSLDALAKAGVRCTSGYVTAPYCSPSRAGLLSGRYQTRFGHEFNADEITAGLPLTETTVASRLKTAGYVTGLVGKWHQGRAEQFHPQNRGFDEFFGFLPAAHDYFDDAGLLRGREPVEEREYLTDAFGREAVSFIERHKNETWFLYLAFNAVHTPMQADDPRLKKFEHVSDTKRRTYAAMMSALDDNVGRVRKKLDELGLTENTLVTFNNDNGGPTMPSTATNGSINKPLRGSKRTTLEGGIRVPFLVSWPGHVNPGVYDRPVITLDFTATALVAAGLKPQPDWKLEGVDLAPFLAGKNSAAPHDALYWRFGRQMAIRDGDYKLVRYDTNADTLSGAPNQPTSPPRLYHLTDDIGEANDLAAKMPDKLNELDAKWNAWNKDNVPPLWTTGLGGTGAKVKKAKKEVGSDPEMTRAKAQRRKDARQSMVTRLVRLLIFLLCAFALLRENLCLAAPAAESPRPNILILLADDLGWSDVGCYGGEIKTPHIDKLAAGGLRYTQFYNCTRCCPSRASLLTGLYPHQTGVGSMTGDQHQPGYRGSLQPNCLTFAQVLKSAGYKTAMSGKWHVGDNVSPISRGFDDFYGWTRGYAVNSWEPRMMIRLPAGRPQRSYQPGEYFATDAITDHALDFLAEMRKGDSPWLMYVAYQAPHFPVQSKPEDMQGYAEKYAAGWDAIRQDRLARQKQIGLLPAGTELTPRSQIPLVKAAERNGSATADGHNPAWDSLPSTRQADLAQRMAVYAGMVSGMDRNIGRLIDDLRANGQLDNTLIVFTSDNGACAEWEPFGFDLPPIADPQPGVGINQGTQAAANILRQDDELAKLGGPTTSIGYGSAWANASTTPWRLYKHYCHEGGISSPLVAHWPARIKSRGQFRTQVGHLIDIMATCVELSGAEYPAQQDGRPIDPLEGKSLVPSFDDRATDRDFLAWEHEGNAALRAGDWKLVRQGANGDWELYNLTADRSELHNLAAKDAERVQKMSAQWQTWAQRCHVFPKPGG